MPPRDTGKLRERISEIGRDAGAQALAVAVRDLETSIEFDHDSDWIICSTIWQRGSATRERVPSAGRVDPGLPGTGLTARVHPRRP